MKRVLVLLALGACTFDASNDPIWRGTVRRDGGPPLTFAGFDPYPAQGYQFGGGISAMGYLDSDDGKLLVEVGLEFTDKHDFENAKSQAFPITLTITDSSLTAGMGVDFFEQPASESDDKQHDQTFHHDYSQLQTGTSSGTFTVTRCDYSTYMDGHLSATVMDPNHGGATRVLDLEVQYSGDK
jgi:hypothetical protein